MSLNQRKGSTKGKKSKVVTFRLSDELYGKLEKAVNVLIPSSQLNKSPDLAARIIVGMYCDGELVLKTTAKK